MTPPRNSDSPSGDTLRALVAENEAQIEDLFDRHGLGREERGEVLFDVLVLFGIRQESISDPERWLVRELEHRCERLLTARAEGDEVPVRRRVEPRETWEEGEP